MLYQKATIIKYKEDTLISKAFDEKQYIKTVFDANTKKKYSKDNIYSYEPKASIKFLEATSESILLT